MSRPPLQFVEHVRQDSLGHRVCNKVMAVLLVVLILCLVWRVL